MVAQYLPGVENVRVEDNERSNRLDAEPPDFPEDSESLGTSPNGPLRITPDGTASVGDQIPQHALLQSWESLEVYGT